MATSTSPLRIDDDVRHMAKIAAAREGIPLARLVATAVTEYLARRGHNTTAATRAIPGEQPLWTESQHAPH